MGHCKSQNGTAMCLTGWALYEITSMPTQFCEQNEDLIEPMLPRMLNYLDQQLMQFRF